MKVELSSIPAIHLGSECVVPQRKTWDVLATRAELAALTRIGEALAERPEDFPLDAEALRALCSAIEALQLVGRAEGDGTNEPP